VEKDLKDKYFSLFQFKISPHFFVVRVCDDFDLFVGDTSDGWQHDPHSSVV
jgi:hypothetical protein